MTAFASPQREHKFRARTVSDSSLAGVTLPSFICSRCYKPRRAAGRQRIVNAYLCADCFDRIKARRRPAA